MSKYPFLLLLLFVSWLSGCTTKPPAVTQQRASFVEQEYEPYRSSGTGRIEGQVFLKTRGGDVKLGAGAKVFLNPATSYSAEWFDHYMRGSTMVPVPSDPQSLPFGRVTTADAMGNFEFSKLPEGTYYVTSGVTWSYVSSSGTTLPTGGTVGRQVRVTNDQTTKVILTR